MGGAISSPMMQYGMQGLVTGAQTGAGIANAQYNAAAARMQAKAITEQSNLQAYLIQQQYLTEYKQLKESQDAQQSANRVAQAKYGITGASADAVMQSYAAKSQKNLETLYYNAAMKTGQQSLQASAQRRAMLEKARQYDWQAVQTGIAGVINLGAGALNVTTRLKQGSTEIDPTANLKTGTPDPTVVAMSSATPTSAIEEMMKGNIVGAGMKISLE